MSVRVSGLFLYPVKSLRGFAVPAAELDDLGFAGDRRFMLVDEAGKFLTQRQLPRMAQVSTALTADTLTLSAGNHGSVTVGRGLSPTVGHSAVAKAMADEKARPTITVSIWKSEGLQAEDCGNEVAAWLSDFLDFKCRLVRIGDSFKRTVLKPAAQPGDVFGFADGAPILVVSEASLADLNDRIQENHGAPVPMNRFRPNLVIADCPAFAEDGWPCLRIGEVVLRNAGKSIRCVITTTDQFTGERGKEPLRTLATFRREPDDPAAVTFGTNYINESKRGTIRIGKLR